MSREGGVERETGTETETVIGTERGREGGGKRESARGSTACLLHI